MSPERASLRINCNFCTQFSSPVPRPACLAPAPKTVEALPWVLRDKRNLNNKMELEERVEGPGDPWHELAVGGRSTARGEHEVEPVLPTNLRANSRNLPQLPAVTCSHRPGDFPLLCSSPSWTSGVYPEVDLKVVLTGSCSLLNQGPELQDSDAANNNGQAKQNYIVGWIHQGKEVLGLAD